VAASTVKALQLLRDRLALASRDNFAGVAKIAGLGVALRMAADDVARSGAGGQFVAMLAWRQQLEDFDAIPVSQREVLVAKGMRIVRGLVGVQPTTATPVVTRVSNARDIVTLTSKKKTKAEPASPLGDPLAAATSSIRGIGPTFAQQLAQSDVHTLEDLLWLVPNRYDDFRRARSIASLQPDDDGQRVVIVGQVFSARMIFARGRRWADVKLETDGASLQIRFFNAWAGIEKKFPVASTICVAGNIKFRSGRAEMANPDVLDVSLSNPIVAYYPRIAGVPPARVKSACHAALQQIGTLADEIPSDVASKLNLPSLIDSMTTLHQPPANLRIEDVDAMLNGVSLWQQRLAFGELFALATAAAMQRFMRCAGVAAACASTDVEQRVCRATGFSLTSAQRRALQHLVDDLAKPAPMNRLLEGDVGSGKTAVAFGAALAAVGAGYQVAIMAPTEVLAEQHEKNFRRWCEALDSDIKIGVALLTASTPTAVRASTLSLVAAGAIHIVVGTHALLSEQVGFANLALVIIDEQQRFGVAQRMRLRNKGGDGSAPHLLVMTATPIPRTLALTAFGDLDRTVIDELPPGRSPIATTVVHGKIGWNQVLKQINATVAKGLQVYVVCPRIEADPDSSPRALAIDAETVHAVLTSTLDASVGLVHSRLDSGTRNATMRSYRDGSLAVMVATTVIEVGVDNPNATLMIILGADRFGLSQLHQLRGRVGRGQQASSCLLHSVDDPTPEGKQRLAAMVETTDGFKIAERDLQLRGPGELFGEQQAGSPRLAIGDQALYIQLLLQAREFAAPLIARDPTLALPEHALLRAAVRRRIGSVFDAHSG
jgi:ATP-dependent DNA helicase RecG